MIFVKKLNNKIIKNWYFLPLINKSFNWPKWTTRFRQFDLRSVSHRMQIWERKKWKMVLRIRYYDFKYQIIFFDLFNAPDSFQGYINKILTKKLDIFVIVYLDNISIYTNKVDHIDFIQWVFKQLKNYLLYINLKKCYFYQDKMQFFSYIIFF